MSEMSRARCSRQAQPYLHRHSGAFNFPARVVHGAVSVPSQLAANLGGRTSIVRGRSKARRRAGLLFAAIKVITGGGGNGGLLHQLAHSLTSQAFLDGTTTCRRGDGPTSNVPRGSRLRILAASTTQHSQQNRLQTGTHQHSIPIKPIWVTVVLLWWLAGLAGVRTQYSTTVLPIPFVGLAGGIRRGVLEEGAHQVGCRLPSSHSTCLPTPLVGTESG